MQAGEQEVDTKKREHRDDESSNDKDGHYLACVLTHETEVKIGGIGEPCDQRPGFLWVPAPPYSPGFFCPDRTEYEGPGREDGIAYRYARVSQPVVIFSLFFGFCRQLQESAHETSGEKRLADEGEGYMEHKPPGLESRHGWPYIGGSQG